MSRVKCSKIVFVTLALCILSATWSLQVQAEESGISEEEKMQTVSSTDERIKWTLSKEWSVFGESIMYEDSYYDEYGINKEVIDELVSDTNDGLLALHKYMDWNITISRVSVENMPDYASATQEQMDIMLGTMEEEIEEANEEDQDEMRIDILQLYENKSDCYIVFDAYYYGLNEERMVVYQTTRGNEMIIISLEGPAEFMENQVLVHELIDNLEYDFPQVLFEDLVEEKEKEIYRNMGRAVGSFIVIGNLIAVVIIVIIVITVIYKSGRK